MTVKITPTFKISIHDLNHARQFRDENKLAVLVGWLTGQHQIEAVPVLTHDHILFDKEEDAQAFVTGWISVFRERLTPVFR